MRLGKELMLINPSDLKVPFHEYQHLIGLGVRTLGDLERRVLILRFGQFLTIAEVADRMRITWEEADGLIDQAVEKVHRVMKRHLKSQSGG